MFTKEGLGFLGEQTVKKILDAYQGIAIWGVVLFFILAVVITVLVSYTHSNKKLRRKNDELIKARSANEEKSRFLFNMSHDLRTPMNSILGFSQIARNNINDAEKVEDCLKKIESSGQHLLRLINDVLDMAKIENGKMDYRDEPTDIRERI